MATKRKKRKRGLIIYFSVIVISILYIMIGHAIAVRDLKVFAGRGDVQPQSAQVIQITDRQEYDYDLGDSKTATGAHIYFEAKLLDGPEKGETVKAVQNIDPFFAIQPPDVTKGKKVLIMASNDESYDARWIMVEYVRTGALWGLAVIFCFCLFWFGRIKGINTIISLLFTILSIFYVFIPSVLSGKNIYLWSIMTCIFIIVMTLLIVNGASKKSLAAGVGCFCGIAAVGIITLIMDAILHLTGMIDEQAVYLQMLDTPSPINLKAIIFAAIIIGAIGAIMDVSISISAALHELSRKVYKITFSNVLYSGVTIGRDIMGTMANTLVLAYIGSSLSLTLLLVAYNNSFVELLNREMIVVEILQMLVGSFGILLTIPLTSIVCAALYTSDWKDPDSPLTSMHVKTDLPR